MRDPDPVPALVQLSRGKVEIEFSEAQAAAKRITAHQTFLFPKRVYHRKKRSQHRGAARVTNGCGAVHTRSNSPGSNPIAGHPGFIQKSPPGYRTICGPHVQSFRSKEGLEMKMLRNQLDRPIVGPGGRKGETR